MLARLQTATSSGAVYSTISVQRLLLWMVPRFFWLLFRLQASCAVPPKLFRKRTLESDKYHLNTLYIM